MPLNVLLVEALRRYAHQLGREFVIEYPTGSGRRVPLAAAADDLSARLISLFLPDKTGLRPVHRSYELLSRDPRWQDNIAFHEYFHGDSGAGLGASHQTGWTALVAHLILTSTEGTEQ